MRYSQATFIVALILATQPSVAAAQSSRARSPIPTENPGSWFSKDNYPTMARRLEQQGRVTIELSVDATGAVTGCVVTGSSGYPLLDDQTCYLAQTKGRFDPARDRRGKAVPGTVSLPGIRWELDPETRFGVPADADEISEIDLDASGGFAACREVRTDKLLNGPGFCLLPPTEVAASLAGRSVPAVFEFRSSIRLGKIAKADQLPPPDHRVFLLIQMSVLLNELGNPIECVVLRAEGPANMPSPCDSELPKFQPTVGDDGAPKQQSIVITQAISSRSVKPTPSAAP